MTNKLFIVCPFSNMEIYLRNKYGKDIFFMTFPGGVIQDESMLNSTAIHDFIKLNNIQTLYLVNETSCRFLNAIINKTKLVGLAAEGIIESMYIDHYLYHFNGKTISVQQQKLAELNIRSQASELIKTPTSESSPGKTELKIIGIITSKRQGLINEINIK